MPEISEAFVTQMTTLLAARFDPLLETVQRHLDRAAERIESQYQPSRQVSHPSPDRQPERNVSDGLVLVNDGDPAQQSPQARDLSAARINYVADVADVADAIHLSSTPPPLPARPISPPPATACGGSIANPDQPDAVFLQLQRTAMDVEQDAHVILIQKPSEMEAIRQRLGDKTAAADAHHQQSLECKGDGGGRGRGDEERDNRQTLLLPRSAVDRIEAGRARRMRHLAAYMGTAVTTSAEYGPSVQGPWDAVEIISSDFVQDILDSVLGEVASVADEFVDNLFSQEFGVGLNNVPGSASGPTPAVAT
ncbi:hypothetical protein BC831DRAFT_511112 [Entophlyctis helioformis]|nr:hypothetical protein BC831DRAFT_511112 [Entophlyctis helioformis]